uniref:Uncharacterized protein n=1 Tax=Sinocyclocheilus rhinocerous TaxID=307959 RepID=A0A673L195_9TELE
MNTYIQQGCVKWIKSDSKDLASPSGSDLPVLRRCEADIPAHLTLAQTWLESLGSRDSEPLGVVDLHPDVFSVPLRLDILHAVEVWQRNFKRIVSNYEVMQFGNANVVIVMIYYL